MTVTVDPGLQLQRTTLAWTRTGLCAGALGGVLLRGALRTGSGVALAAAVAGVLGAVAILGLGSRALRPSRRLPGPQRSCDHRGVRAVTAVVLVVGVLTVGTVVLG